MHYLYRITNQINGKIYIGQTNDLKRRWQAHKTAAKNSAEQIIHYAILKHGVVNFSFEHIATCQTWDEANELETLLVEQYESHILTGKGYNSTRGGFNASKTEEWILEITQKAQERAPQTSEQMKVIAAARSEDYYDYMSDNKYAEGMKHTEEWKEMMRNREHSEEEKVKRSDSLKASYAAGERTSYFRENEPWNKGSSGLQVPWNKGIKASEETKQKISEANKGNVAWNKGLPPEQQSRFGAKLTKEHKKALAEGNKKKRHFTDEQVKNIKADFAADSSRGAQTRLAKKYGVRQQMINKLLNDKSYN